MFKAMKQFTDQFGPAGTDTGQLSKDERAKRHAAQKELDDQLKAAPGADRYQTCRYEHEWTYGPLNAIAKEYSVPKQTAFKVINLRTVAQEQAKQVRADTSMSDDQRKEALAAIRNETESAMARVLGQDAAKAYFKRTSWTRQPGK